jgi:hypothetical protein
MARLLFVPALIIACLFIFFIAAQSEQTSMNSSIETVEQMDLNSESNTDNPNRTKSGKDSQHYGQDQPQLIAANESSILETLTEMFSSLRDVFTHIARLDQQVNETLWESIPSEGSFFLGIYSSARCLLTLFGFSTLLGLVGIWRKLTS